MNLLTYGVLFTIFSAFIIGFGMGRDSMKDDEGDE